MGEGLYGATIGMIWFLLMGLLWATPVEAAKFVIGDRIVTNTLYPGVLVRDTPGGNRLGSQPQGAQGTVVGGPAVALNIIWWQINYDTGLDGWSSEDALDLVAGPPVIPGIPGAPTVTMTTSVQLVWTANSEADLAGYKVYSSFTSGVYGAPNGTVTAPTAKVSNMQAGKQYFFTVTAYDQSGNESQRSNEVTYTVP